ncbi:MAG: mannonate dehydratase [Candidatus Latescibacterota bacterium]|nr:mannonate dehydratase [Candidatus Latescibacterota bacterium]
MRIGLVLNPFSNETVRLAAQLGATEVVAGMPSGDFDELVRFKSQIEDAGLQLSVIEGLMSIDDVVLGNEARDACIKEFQEGLRNMGAAGIPTLCYNFMVWRPGVGVARTSYTTRDRGGAWVSSFDASLLDNAPPIAGATLEEEQVWDHLEHFLKQVIPVAEDAGVKLAMHPDDPPMSLRGQARIMSSVENFERLVNLVESPCNGITFCQGCFSEMGAGIPETIRRFGEHIHFVHFRDVQGQVPKFRETFHDNGKTDMLAAMAAYKEIGFDGVMRPDHAPFLHGAGDEGDPTGYTMLGKIFAVGYMKGLMEAV